MGDFMVQVMEIGGFMVQKGRQCCNKAIAFGKESQIIEKEGVITENGQKNNGRR